MKRCLRRFAKARCRKPPRSCVRFLRGCRPPSPEFSGQGRFSMSTRRLNALLAFGFLALSTTAQTCQPTGRTMSPTLLTEQRKDLGSVQFIGAKIDALVGVDPLGRVTIALD